MGRDACEARALHKRGSRLRRFAPSENVRKRLFCSLSNIILKLHLKFFLCLSGEDLSLTAAPQHLNFATISSAKAEDSYSLNEEEIAEIIVEDRSLGRDVSGHVVFTAPCHLIAPCVLAPGTLTVTSEALFFTVDEENAEYQKLDPKVSIL